METTIQMQAIGHVRAENGHYSIQLNDAVKKGMTGLNGFTHLQVLWWPNLADQSAYRNQLVNKKPYKKGPDLLGVFATRSQFRPNPVLVTTIRVEKIDVNNGVIYTPYIDAENNTPVLDIKPYHYYERVEQCKVPDWCDHWPVKYEDAAYFNWAAEFNF